MERLPLGEHSYKIAISRDELRMLAEHRERTGEPMQTFVRRLIRENWERCDPLPEDLGVVSTPSLPTVLGPVVVQRELFTERELAGMAEHEVVDVPRLRWCVAYRRDARSARRNNGSH